MKKIADKLVGKLNKAKGNPNERGELTEKQKKQIQDRKYDEGMKSGAAKHNKGKKSDATKYMAGGTVKANKKPAQLRGHGAARTCPSK